MPAIQIESTAAPFDEAATAARAFRVFQTAEAMGLYRPAHAVRVLDLASFRDLVRSVQRAGIARFIHLGLDADTPAAEVRRTVDDLLRALEESPSPDTEWKRLAEVIGPDALAARAGISTSSLARYHGGQRVTPDDVAERLHFLALVVGNLAGAYNDIGIRRWFERRRAALDGRRPADILAGEWVPDAPGPRAVRALAEGLASSPVT